VSGPGDGRPKVIVTEVPSASGKESLLRERFARATNDTSHLCQAGLLHSRTTGAEVRGEGMKARSSAIRNNTVMVQTIVSETVVNEHL
jgi:hypothetical protein